MIEFNTNLTQEDAKWVLENSFPYFGYRIAHPTLSRIMEGYNKVFTTPVGIPGCSCEYKATHAVWTSRLSQYKSQIEAIANPVIIEPEPELITSTTKTRGRKKNVTL